MRLFAVYFIPVTLKAVSSCQCNITSLPFFMSITFFTLGEEEDIKLKRKRGLQFLISMSSKDYELIETYKGLTNQA